MALAMLLVTAGREELSVPNVHALSNRGPQLQEMRRWRATVALCPFGRGLGKGGTHGLLCFALSSQRHRSISLSVSFLFSSLSQAQDSTLFCVRFFLHARVACFLSFPSHQMHTSRLRFNGHGTIVMIDFITI